MRTSQPTRYHGYRVTPLTVQSPDARSRSEPNALQSLDACEHKSLIAVVPTAPMGECTLVNQSGQGSEVSIPGVTIIRLQFVNRKPRRNALATIVQRRRLCPKLTTIRKPTTSAATVSRQFLSRGRDCRCWEPDRDWKPKREVDSDSE